MILGGETFQNFVLCNEFMTFTESDKKDKLCQKGSSNESKMYEKRPQGRPGSTYSSILWILGPVEKTLFYDGALDRPERENRGVERPRVEKGTPELNPWDGSGAEGLPTTKEKGVDRRTKRQEITHAMGRRRGEFVFPRMSRSDCAASFSSFLSRNANHLATAASTARR